MQVLYKLNCLKIIHTIELSWNTLSWNTSQLIWKNLNFVELERSQLEIGHFRVFHLTLKTVYGAARFSSWYSIWHSVDAVNE